MSKPNKLMIEMGRYTTYGEAVFAHNLTHTILAQAQGKKPDPKDLYRMDPDEIPNENRQQEIFYIICAELEKAL